MSIKRASRHRRVGHLGDRVSALVDGQIDSETAERLWQHTAECPTCEQAVDAERWVKRRMAVSGELRSPQSVPQSLVGSLRELPEQVERLSRPRVILARRRRYVLAGAGSVSAALVGFAALSGGAPTASGPGTSVSPAGDSSTSLVSAVSTSSGDEFLSVVFVTH